MVCCVPNDLLRGLDNEMVLAVVNVHEDCGGVLLRLDRLNLCLVALGGL